MPNVTSILKEEIVRLARKELRTIRGRRTADCRPHHYYRLRQTKRKTPVRSIKRH